MIDSFQNNLEKKIQQSVSNDFGIENYDEFRFGKYPSAGIKNFIKRLIKWDNYLAKRNLKNFSKYENNLQYIWERVNAESQELLVSTLAYRILGFKKVKLPLNNADYWQSIDIVKTLKDPQDTYDPHFLHIRLEKFDLNRVGYNIKLYYYDIAIYITFVLEQYTYKLRNNVIVQAEKGDYVLDVGGCWGDTALYFAHKVGPTGKVFSFEFIPDNIKLHSINTSLNPHLRENILLITNPVSNISHQMVYYKNNGPSSTIRTKPFYEQTGWIETISIDDYIEDNKIERVDFIKMDIEGSELMALEGAYKTIVKFKPKLAIAIYHDMEEFTNIPKWIFNLKLDYEIFIGHYTIHAEETICFAKPKR
jgi:FkbM family methyltransferase